MRNLEEIECEELEYQGTKYLFTGIYDDVSEHFEKPKGSVKLTHRIEGFEVPVFLIINEVDNELHLSYMLEEANLMVSVMDEDIYDKVVTMFHILQNQGE